jgi:hypothetical protein
LFLLIFLEILKDCEAVSQEIESLQIDDSSKGKVLNTEPSTAKTATTSVATPVKGSGTARGKSVVGEKEDTSKGLQRNKTVGNLKTNLAETQKSPNIKPAETNKTLNKTKSTVNVNEDKASTAKKPIERSGSVKRIELSLII